RLGEVAANPLWDSSTRQQAVDFLRELYKNDAEWGKQTSSKKWILTLLKRLTLAPNREIKEYALVVLKDLERSGDGGRQELYRAHMKEASSPFPLEAAVQTPLTSPLLTRAQDIPNVEEDLRRLRKRQLKDRTDAVYIPPRAKPSQQASNSASFDLMEYARAFLKRGSQVFLLLGDSGAGKSTFNRELECTLWTTYSSSEDAIPLLIHLPSIDRPEKDLVAKHLRRCDFSESQIRELKNNRRFILICDGYDECQQIYNLHTSNNLNSNGQWQAKMVISCRSEHLGHDYKDRFQSSTDAATSSGVGSKQLQEAVIIPFSTVQIHDYIHRYVAVVRPPWRAKSYLTALERVPNLMDLIRNPFLLTLSLDVLPGFVDVDKIQDLSDVSITRVGLYDRFVEHWLERGKKRVGGRDLSQQARAAFDTLVDEGFTANGIDFLKRFAAAIYKEQAGHPIVEYSGFKDEETWKARFFSRKDENQLLREACPLARNGNQHRFVHKSLLEYCFARAVFDPQTSQPPLSGPSMTRRGSVSSMFSFDEEAAAEECDLRTRQAVLSSPLAWRSFVEEPSILQFLSERVQQEPSFKEQLLMMIENSKTDKDGRIAATNAITILVRAGTPFIGADLRGIRIPGADLSCGMFEGAQLQGADVRRANFYNIWLRQADLSDSQMTGVRWDGVVRLWDTQTGALGLSFTDANMVFSFAYSPDGHQIALGCGDNIVRLRDAQTGVPGPILTGHGPGSIRSLVYSPSGHQIATGGADKTVRLWDAQTGSLGLTMTGHSDSVNSVAYSPSGHQIASGSADKTVRLWDAQTGSPGPILTGHDSDVRKVSYSPSGHQIASASHDRTIRLWDAQTGTPSSIRGGNNSLVTCAAWSPSGTQIALGSEDHTVRLWNAQTGASGPVLAGHTSFVYNVVYSPNGHHIASVSDDKTVRLWDAQTGAAGHILTRQFDSIFSAVYSPSGHQIALAGTDAMLCVWDTQSGELHLGLTGHTGFICSAVYSPSGHQLASGGKDKTVRLWNAQTGESGPVLRGHTGWIKSLVYSPSGHQLASVSWNEDVRVWDPQTGTLLSVLIGHLDCVKSVAYSPSGHQIASASNDKTVRVWGAESGACTLVLKGHTAEVWTVAYSRSGQRVASCSKDGTVRLWDAVSGDCLTSLNDVDKPITWLAWRESDAGSFLATSNEGGTIRMWQEAETEGKAQLNLHWSSPHTSMNAMGANIQNAHGLNRTQVRLLKQRGSVGEPIPPLSIRGAGKKLMRMAATASRLCIIPKTELLDDFADESSAGEIEPNMPLKEAEQAVEE
ncbi:Transducin (beta)-like 1 X-linked receptor 1, partial [Mortierella antarctica]